MKKDSEKVKPNPERKDVITFNVLKNSIFDTKNYYYYFTEIRKD